MPEREVPVWHGRTHPKVLFRVVLIEALIIALHTAAVLWLPRDTSLEWFNTWAWVVIHGTLLLANLWYGVIPFLRWISSTYTVTNLRVVANWGLLYKQSREIPIDRIVSVSVERGILDRIFRCGTLVLHDAAAMMQTQTSGPWNVAPAGGGVRFSDVPRVLHVQALIDDLRFKRAGSQADTEGTSAP